MKKERLVLPVIFPLLTLAAFVLCNAQQIAAEDKVGTLDGKTYTVSIGKVGKKAEGRDNLIFKDGRFRSSACDPYGFGEAVYSTQVEGDTIIFEAQTESVKHGKILWRGTVKGEGLEGTYDWYKIGRESKPPIGYWMKGELKETR